jgi:hypothetical protein
MFAEREGPPFLPGWAALLLWLAPPFSIPFGLMEIPVVQPVFAVVLLVALFRWQASPRPALSPTTRSPAAVP